jgi:hypothetical protein
LSRFKSVSLLDGLWIGCFNLLHYSELHVITALSLISTIHSSSHPLRIFQPAVSSPTVLWRRLLTVEILQLPSLRFFLHRPSFTSACQLFPQMNWIVISSQSHLRSSTAHSTTKFQLSSFITTLNGPNRNIFSNKSSIVV